jgi:hypothetical protein
MQQKQKLVTGMILSIQLAVVFCCFCCTQKSNWLLFFFVFCSLRPKLAAFSEIPAICTQGVASSPRGGGSGGAGAGGPRSTTSMDLRSRASR